MIGVGGDEVACCTDEGLLTVNGEPIEASKNKVLFENLTPLFPRKRFKLERGVWSSIKSWHNAARR